MIVYGRNVAEEFLNNKNKVKKVKKVILQVGFRDNLLNSLIENCKLPVVYKDKFEISRLANGNHQGIMLDIEDYKFANLEDIISDDEDSLIVVLDHLEDPHNVGAIIRTAEAAGVLGIIMPHDRSCGINSTVMKTSAGALENIKICEVINLVNTLKILKDKGYWIIGTDMEESTDYRKINYKGKTVLVLGSEGEGMNRLVKETCDFIAKIPMYGMTNSLNVSVAAGILIYEAIRNRK
ncbi:MAG: 23S rRNA (guanosine(2251)-2'-O)-methyltransferase RlmB [Bacilli bacterium]